MHCTIITRGFVLETIHRAARTLCKKSGTVLINVVVLLLLSSSFMSSAQQKLHAATAVLSSSWTHLVDWCLQYVKLWSSCQARPSDRQCPANPMNTTDYTGPHVTWIPPPHPSPPPPPQPLPLKSGANKHHYKVWHMSLIWMKNRENIERKGNKVLYTTPQWVILQQLGTLLTIPWCGQSQSHQPCHN